MFGYSFVPINDCAINIASSIVIVCFAILSFIKNDKKTGITTLSSVVLPIISILFFTVKGLVTDLKNIDIFVIHCLITYVISLVLFFLYGHEKRIKIGFGIIYSFLLIPISFIFFLIVVFYDFSRNTVVKSEKSPNSLYLAEIIDNNQGALGGSTKVKVIKQNCSINLLLGKIEKNPTVIYSGKWSEFNEMNLRWETDEILYINERKYEIKK